MDYMDAWRFLNEDKKGFTWRRLQPDKKQARLDYFLISNFMFFFLHTCEIIPGYRSDHSGVLLKLQINFETEKGHGYWKFNNTLLRDMDYVKKIKKNVIKESLDRYSLDNNNDNYNNNNNNNNNNKTNIYDNNNFSSNNRKERRKRKGKRFNINDQLL